MKNLLVFVLLVATSAPTSQGAPPTLPQLVSGLLPMYPERARLAHMASTVRLWFQLDASGAVTHAEVISGHPILGEPALMSVKSWKFDPHHISTGTRYETEFVYTLKSREKEGPPTITVSIADFRHVEVGAETYVATTF
jgi:TonB family protein